uniref:Beta-microseminoprotein-like n=1 Tax=Salmo trutta TaxID=8032 RepID=A0A674F2I7_SALTR
MKSLALALILCVLLPLFHASCYMKPMTLKPGEVKGEVKGMITHCRDDKDKTWHPIGSRWRNSDCMDCTCNSCCQGYATPVEFPDDCMKEWDQKACEFKVVKKSDPSISCPIFGSVGK